MQPKYFYFPLDTIPKNQTKTVESFLNAIRKKNFKTAQKISEQSTPEIFKWLIVIVLQSKDIVNIKTYSTAILYKSEFSKVYYKKNFNDEKNFDDDDIFRIKLIKHILDNTELKNLIAVLDYYFFYNLFKIPLTSSLNLPVAAIYPIVSSLLSKQVKLNTLISKHLTPLTFLFKKFPSLLNIYLDLLPNYDKFQEVISDNIKKASSLNMKAVFETANSLTLEAKPKNTFLLCSLLSLEKFPAFLQLFEEGAAPDAFGKGNLLVIFTKSLISSLLTSWPTKAFTPQAKNNLEIYFKLLICYSRESVTKINMCKNMLDYSLTRSKSSIMINRVNQFNHTNHTIITKALINSGTTGYRERRDNIMNLCNLSFYLPVELWYYILNLIPDNELPFVSYQHNKFIRNSFQRAEDQKFSWKSPYTREILLQKLCFSYFKLPFEICKHIVSFIPFRDLIVFSDIEISYIRIGFQKALTPETNIISSP